MTDRPGDPRGKGAPPPASSTPAAEPTPAAHPPPASSTPAAEPAPAALPPPASSTPAAKPAAAAHPSPAFAPAAKPAAAAHPPPSFPAIAAPAIAAPVASPPPAAAAEPAAPSVVVSGELASGATPPRRQAAAAPPPVEEPLLPGTYRVSDLRTAVGVSPEPARRDDDDDDDGGDAAPPRRRRAVLVVGGAALLGVGAITLMILGHLNAARYVLGCETKEVFAEEGRAFPPWGTRRLTGDAWKPIPIPPSFQCVTLETEDEIELSDAYRTVLLERAESLLTAKEATQIEPAAELLDQALLHARTDSEPHKAARQAIQRMLGDVAYWRASAKLQKATTDLADAAKQFEAAAGQRPRYAADAGAWAAYVRKLVDDLRAGPSGTKAQPPAPSSAVPPAPDRPPAPAGVALPVEPRAGSGSGSGSAAGSGGRAGSGSAEAPPAAVTSGGGVLL